MMNTTLGKLGVFIPTLGDRPGYILEAIDSISKSVSKERPVRFFVLIESFLRDRISEVERNQIVEITSDHILPLPEKVLRGVALLQDCDYITWLGDDDLLDEEALERGSRFLDLNQDVSLVFGQCDYISADGNLLFTNSAGAIARSLLTWGPDLIPQPGAIWRRRHYESVGGISTDLQLAFDFDLFIKLAKVGNLEYVPGIRSKFRWHAESSSVAKRWRSVIEASKVRLRHAKGMRALAQFLIEPAIILATWLAGWLTSQRAKRIQSKLN